MATDFSLTSSKFVRLVPILSQENSVHFTPSYSVKFHFNTASHHLRIGLHSGLRFSRVSTETCVNFSSTRTGYMPSPLHTPVLEHMDQYSVSSIHHDALHYPLGD